MSPPFSPRAPLLVGCLALAACAGAPSRSIASPIGRALEHSLKKQDASVPSTHEALLHAGREALIAGDPERARALVTRAIAIRDTPFAQCVLGWAEHQLGDDERAAARLGPAVEDRDVSSADSARNRLCQYRYGRVLEVLGRYGEAQRAYRAGAYQENELPDATRARIDVLRSLDPGDDAQDAAGYCLRSALREADHFRFCRSFAGGPYRVLYEGFWDQGRDMSSLSLAREDEHGFEVLGRLTGVMIEMGHLRDPGRTTSEYTAEVSELPTLSGGGAAVRLRLNIRWTDRQYGRYSLSGTSVDEIVCGQIDERWRCAQVIIDRARDLQCEGRGCRAAERERTRFARHTLTIERGTWNLRLVRPGEGAREEWLGHRALEDVLAEGRPLRGR